MLTSLSHAKLDSSTPYSTRQKGAGMKECSNTVLLQNIAERQDQASFDELYKRFEQPAYNLAYQITSSRETAMEAVQEAMLRVWISIKQFDPERSARGWVFRIVVRESIRLCRMTRADNQRRIKKAAEGPAEQKVHTEGIERNEEMAAMRASLEQLPARSKRLLALYYGAGMSQREIAQAESISQRSVSNKLEESINLLRAQLARMGLASALPLLDSPALGEVLLSMHPVPLELKAEVFKKLGPLNVTSATAKQWMVIPAALVLMGSLSLAAYQFLRTDGAFQSENQPSAPMEERTVLTPSDKKPLRVEWTFENGLPKDIAIKQGAWNWQAGSSDTSACVKIAYQPASILLLPQRVSKKAHVVTLDVYHSENSMATFYPAWASDTLMPACWEKFSVLKRSRSEKRKPSVTFRYKAYMYGKFIFVEHSNNIVHALRYESEYPGDRICLIVKNWRIIRILLEEVDEKELPDSIKDPESYFNTIKGKRHVHSEFKFVSNVALQD